MLKTKNKQKDIRVLYMSGTVIHLLSTKKIIIVCINDALLVLQLSQKMK